MDDVIVIGAGPGGNTAAYHLAQLGYSVTVIDSNDEIGNKLCTGIVGLECLNKFPTDDATIIREASTATFFSPSSVAVELSKEDTQAYVLNRVAYVASIANKAKSMGAHYIKSHVSNVEVHENHVEVRANDRNTSITRKSRIIIIAGGFRTNLTQQVGLGTITDVTTGTQAEVVSHDQEKVQVFFGANVAPGFFGWLVPTSPDRSLVGLMARQNAGRYLKRLISKLQSEGKISTITRHSSKWGLPLRPLPRIYSDRVLVVGDAAGQVKPTTGGGIYYSILGGEIAAETIDDALRKGDTSGRQFHQYQKRWDKLTSRDVKIGRGARKLFESLQDTNIDFLMKTIATNGIRKDVLTNTAFSFDWHSTSITRALGHPLLSVALKHINPLSTRIAAKILAN